jgi:hypothetical protein
MSHFKDLRQIRGAKKNSETVLKTRLKIKETTYSLFFVKYLVAKDIFSIFGIFIEVYLRNLTCWEKSKNGFGLSAQKFVNYLLGSVIPPTKQFFY